jgi:hypothetical protein
MRCAAAGPQAERPITANYTQGDVVDLHVALTTNHWGRFEFRVCPRGSTKESQCALLQRWAAGAGLWRACREHAFVLELGS